MVTRSVVVGALSVIGLLVAAPGADAGGASGKPLPLSLGCRAIQNGGNPPHTVELTEKAGDQVLSVETVQLGTAAFLCTPPPTGTTVSATIKSGPDLHVPSPQNAFVCYLTTTIGGVPKQGVTVTDPFLEGDTMTVDGFGIICVPANKE